MDSDAAPLERLSRLLARAGACSRHEAIRAIRAGRVTVEDLTVLEGAALVSPEARIALDGRPVASAAARVVAWHKPRGVLTTFRDPRGRRCLDEALPAELRGLQPVGRLDADSEGLLILTNDGDLSYGLTHPAHAAPKTYRVETPRTLSEEDLEPLRAGMALRDGPTRPAEARVLESSEGGTAVEVVLREGRKRQVRRMFASLGAPVARLVRTAIAGIPLAGLAPGAWRELDARGAADLRALVARREDREE